MESFWHRVRSVRRLVLLALPFFLLRSLLPGTAGDSDALPILVRDTLADFRGEVYFYALELDSGRELEWRADERVQTASVIKVPIMVEAFIQHHEGVLSLDRAVRYDDSSRAQGAGILQDLTPGLDIPLRDAVTLMIVLSDNSATNMVIDAVTLDAVNERLRELGLKKTFLNKKLYQPPPPDLPESRARFGLGVTTAREMGRLMEKIYRRDGIPADLASEMINILRKQRDLNQIPRFLTGKAWEGVSAAHKTGTLNQVRNDVGIVFTPGGDYILSLFAQKSVDRKWTPDNEASVALGRLAEALLAYFRDTR